MALSDTQKAETVKYLGWSGKSIVVGSTNYNSQVADRLKNLTPDIEAEVQCFLSDLHALDEKLKGSWCRLAAKRVDEIELNPDEILMLRSERRRLVRLLSQLLDIPAMGNAGGGMNTSICI